jgi:hypothetical protein
MFPVDEDIINYHILTDKIKRNYHKNKGIIKKYKIIDNESYDNDMKNLIIKDIEYLQRKLKEENEPNYLNKFT